MWCGGGEVSRRGGKNQEKTKEKIHTSIAPTNLLTLFIYIYIIVVDKNNTNENNNIQFYYNGELKVI